MKPISFTIIDSLISNAESRSRLTCPVIQIRESENMTEPEIISPTKIISCDKCSKLFSSQKKLDQHKKNPNSFEQVKFYDLAPIVSLEDYLTLVRSLLEFFMEG